MPPAARAQILRIVLLSIGFVALFVGTAPAAWQGPDTALSDAVGVASYQDRLFEVASARTPVPSGPRTLATLEIRIGPGAGYVVVGSLPRGASLDVVGQDRTGSWLAVALVQGNKLNGWVPRHQVSDVPGLEELPLAPITLFR